MVTRRAAAARTLGVVAIICSVIATTFDAATAAAQPVSPINVSTSGGTPILIDGIEPEKQPAGVSPGQTVCAPGPMVYKTEGDRYIFQQWSDGGRDKCITPTRPGAYRAIYNHEVLVAIKSTAPGIQRSMWARYAEPIPLEVPEIVQSGEDSRYRFESWSDGETQFERTNTIAPVKPTVLEVKWTREHRLQVDGPDSAGLKGSGWYADGTNLVLHAPDTLAGDTDQDRFKFTNWESTSFPPAIIQNPQNATAALAIQMPYTVRAVYQKQYLVSATSPLGTLKRDWVNDGQDVVLETVPVVDVVPDQERMVFKRWDGIDGLSSPKITGKVDKPIVVSAVYERQVMLKVNAPHGAAGDGWQKAGNVVSVSVPGSVSEMFLLNSTFSNFGGYPAGQSSVQVLVNEPMTLTALYRTEPNLGVLALVLALPLLAVCVYLAGTRGGFIWLRARGLQLRDRIRLGVRGRGRRAMPASSPATTRGPLDRTSEYSGRNGTHQPVPVGDELN